MSFSYLWTPRTAHPAHDSTITIRTWEGKPVPDATFTYSKRQVLFTVAKKGRYTLQIRAGSQSESVTVDIPISQAQVTLPQRVEKLEDSNTRLNFIIRGTTSEAEIQKAIALGPWHNALAGRDDTPARWCAIGDDITEGASASSSGRRWIQRSVRQVRHNYPTENLTDGGFGYLPAYYEGTAMGQPYTSTTGTWVKNTSFGLGRRCAQMSANASFTYNFTGTSFELWYAQGTASGDISVAIDGGLPTTVPTAGPNILTARRWKSPQLTEGAHTVTITAATNDVYFEGLTVYNKDENKGIHLYDAGHWGYDSRSWADNEPHWDMAFNSVDPHLISIALMTNDLVSGINPEESEANIEKLIARARERIIEDPSIALVLYPRRGDVLNTAYPWEGYIAAAHRVAEQDPSIFVLDLSRKMSDGSKTNSGLWTPNRVHPSDKGHAYIADMFVRQITP